MSSTASVPVPSDSESTRQQQIMTAFPTLLEKTEKQMAILLGIVNRLEDIISEDNSSDGGPEFPEEVRKKAIGTTLMALHQIDNSIEDMKRWSAEGDALEQTYKRYLNTAADLADSHLIRTRQDTMPHVRYSAKLYRLDINDWMACLVSGKDELPLGRGPTAADAYRDFDLRFLKGFDPANLRGSSEEIEEEATVVVPKKRKSPRKALKK